MEQNSCTPQQSCERDRAIPFEFPAARGWQPMAVQTNDEPQHQREAEQAGLHQQLHIVVVRFVYEQVRIETAETWVDRGESSQPPAPNWPLGKHPQAIFGDIQTNSRAE